MCAAFGNVQLKKLSKFKKTREHNFKELYNFIQQYEKFFVLPKQDKNVVTQWLAFPLTIKHNAPFDRLKITTYLEQNNVQTRPIFTGNILKQPGFKNIPHKGLTFYPNTDEIMERGFLIGCHHGLEKKHLVRLKFLFKHFLQKYN
jgi:CDP-6-deoxy-D-xylo-4-hexulose-3-dehydrase